MAMQTSEWGDIPSSNELFGGELFGDELMEMYGSSGVGHESDHEIPSLLADSSATNEAEISDDHPVKKGDIKTTSAVKLEGEESKHPGVLVAMNAAAMDDGLRVVSSDFTPLPSTTAADATKASVEQPSSAAPAGILATAAIAPAPSVAPTFITRPPTSVSHVLPIAAYKRPVASVSSHSATEIPIKKRKALVPPKPKLAATGRVSFPAVVKSRSFSAVAQMPSAKMPVSRGTTVPVPNFLLPKNATSVNTSPTIASKYAVITTKAKMPIVGGIPHQVPAKATVVPSAVMSSTTLKKGTTTLTAIAKCGAEVVKPVLMKAQLNVDGEATKVTKRHTEADFKDIAHAAVSTLIQNATNGLSSVMKPVIPVKVSSRRLNAVEKIDTSTAHVNALTSQNWVTACNPVPPPPEPSACDKAARNARRACLTQDERAKQNRDRNREHARNTRLRKKAYVEELKRTLTEIVAQRDAAELEKRHTAQREREQREVRFRVMEEFLKLRGRNELNAARWIAILEDGFTLTLPKTPFRAMVDTGISRRVSENSSKPGRQISSYDLEQVLRGASATLEDSQLLSKFLQTIGHVSANSPPIQIVYRCDRKRFFMDGNITFMDFAASTLGAKNKGAESEIVFKGSMRSFFSPASNKLISVDLSFDTGSIVYQLDHLGVYHSIDTPSAAAAAAAAAAAHEADALLDSLQMPHIYAEKNVTGTVSVSSDDGERSYDESMDLVS